MSAPHLSIVLCLHREGELLAPTLCSLAEAVRFAQADGLILELVAVLDRADAATRDVYKREIGRISCAARSVSVDSGSLGPARNRGVSEAGGDYVCFADGDDLVSFNFFSALYAAARAAEPADVAIMPGVLLEFGEVEGLNWVPDLASVGALNLLSSNPFVSRICQRRDHAEAIPFTDASAASGYAFEDWRRHCDIVSAGFDLRPASQAVLFYRRRRSGLNARGAAHPPAAISPSPLFHPETYLQRCADDYRRWRGGGASGASIAFFRPMHGPLCAAVLAAARRLEPMIPAALRPIQTPFSAAHKQTGAIYYEICAALGKATFAQLIISEGAPERAGKGTLTLGVGSAAKASVAIDADAGLGRIALLGRPDANLILAFKLAQTFVAHGEIRVKDSLFAQTFCARFAGSLGRERVLRLCPPVAADATL